MALAAVVLGTAGRVGSAHAAVLEEDSLAGTSVTAGLVLRAFQFILQGPALRPPRSEVDASPSAVSLFDLRPYASWQTTAVKLVLHGSLATATRSHPATSLDPGGALRPPRLFPLYLRSSDQSTLALTGEVDWAFAAFTIGAATVTIGRQPLTFGRGKVWRAQDLFSMFALTSVDTEYKPGVDAIRLDFTPQAGTQLALIGVLGHEQASHRIAASARGSGLLVRGQLGIDQAEAGVLMGVVRGDLVAGLDATAAAGRFLLYGEATLTGVTSASLPSLRGTGALVPKAVAGLDLTVTARLRVGAEVLVNGFGASSPENYLEAATSPRVGLGEQATLGQVGTVLLLNWQLHPLLDLSAMLLGNPRDPSALGFIGLGYSMADNVTVKSGLYLPIIGSAGERAEFGLYPNFAFLTIKAVL